MKLLTLAWFFPASILALAAAPGPDVVVAADGSGKHTSLQDAISAAPMGTGRDDPRWFSSRRAPIVNGSTCSGSVETFW
jgi:hypothetical protein